MKHTNRKQKNQYNRIEIKPKRQTEAGNENGLNPLDIRDGFGPIFIARTHASNGTYKLKQNVCYRD
jgi:hypothetical protein